MGRRIFRRIVLICSFSAFSLPVLAAPPPEPIVRLITEAARSGNAALLQSTADLAKKTYPASTAEIDGLVASLKANAETTRIARAREQGFFEGWTGEGEVGASLTTGTSRNTSIAVGAKLAKDGVDWRHKIIALEDYQRSNGNTTADRSLASYEADYKFSSRLFILGLLQWEQDRFAGFNRRFTESLGAGYSLVNTPEFTWQISGGPAWRQTRFVSRKTDSDVSGRLATDFLWNITPTTAFSEDGGVYVGGSDNTYFSTTAVTSKILGDISARISFNVTSESNPPPGIEKTNTISRFTLVYSF
jgi:putative salt-induced outer membrane protein